MTKITYHEHFVTAELPALYPSTHYQFNTRHNTMTTIQITRQDKEQRDTRQNEIRLRKWRGPTRIKTKDNTTKIETKRKTRQGNR